MYDEAFESCLILKTMLEARLQLNESLEQAFPGLDKTPTRK